MTTDQRANITLPDGEPYLRDIVDLTAAVVYVKDLQGRYLLVNRQYERIFDVDREKVLGRTDFDLFPPEVAEAFHANDRLVVEQGEVVQFQEQAPHVDGLHTYVSVKFPLRTEDGRLYSVAGISTDITDRVRAENSHEQVTRQLGLILDSVGEGVYGVDRHGHTTFINSAGIQMIGWTAEEVLGRNLHAILHHHRQNGTLYPMEDCPIWQVLQDGSPRRVDDEVFWRKSGSSFPVEYVCTPIVEAGTIAGAVVTFCDLTDRHHRWRAEEEIRAAEAVQQRLFPTESPTISGYDIAGVSYPAANMCGDYFDYIPLPDGSLVIAVGDVSGHGFGPALHMVETRAYLRALLRSGLGLSDCLGRLNGLLHSDMREGEFVSLFLARLKPGGRGMTYAAAGHDARLLRTDGTVDWLLNTGLVLGLVPDVAAPEEVSVAFRPGDLFYLPTDGLAETLSPSQDLFGWQRVEPILQAHRHRSPREIIEELHAAARRHAGLLPQRDDVTLVVVQVRSR